MKITLATPLTTTALTSMAGGRLTLTGGIDPVITHICTDSREADAHTLFCAIRGERVDGHDYMAKAVELGCAAFLCERIPDGLPPRRAMASRRKFRRKSKSTPAFRASPTATILPFR